VTPVPAGYLGLPDGCHVGRPQPAWHGVNLPWHVPCLGPWEPQGQYQRQEGQSAEEEKGGEGGEGKEGKGGWVCCGMAVLPHGRVPFLSFFVWL